MTCHVHEGGAVAREVTWKADPLPLGRFDRDFRRLAGVEKL